MCRPVQDLFITSPLVDLINITKGFSIPIAMQLLSCMHILSLGLLAGTFFLESILARPVNSESVGNSLELLPLPLRIHSSSDSSSTSSQNDSIHDFHYLPLHFPTYAMEEVILHDEIPDEKIENLLETTIETMLKPIIPAIVDSIAQSRPKLGNFLKSSRLIKSPVTRVGYVSKVGVLKVGKRSYNFGLPPGALQAQEMLGSGLGPGP
ncbi:hypothetical protein F5051DRAFT_444832 [Lentinula edodes]|nr:hypothetical protein F5051DRAFT_444832 [Lentinula edodes]